jgi:thiamine-phosphate diphosphorylase
VFRLYLIADRDSFGDDGRWLAAIAAVAPLVAAMPGVGLQVRIRGRVRDASIPAAIALRRIGGARVRALLNADADASGYAGVHSPEAMIGQCTDISSCIGASVHSLDALRRAETAGASFAVFGPVFDPSTKPVRGVGIGPLRAVVSAARIPVLALGGVTPERVPSCLAAGASGVAVASGVFRATNPRAAARRYIAALEAELPASVAD